MALRPGLTGHATLRVNDADTALDIGSGDVPVLGTPRLIALCEEATCRAVDGELGAPDTTVAMRVQFDHLSPSSVGSEVRAEATLEKVEGRRLVFSVSAKDSAGLIGAGKVTRVVVGRDTFLRRAR